MGRIAVVFLVWGGLFGLAVLNGFHAGAAQLAAGMAAGTTLIGWGVALSWTQQKSTVDAPSALPLQLSQRRASV